MASLSFSISELAAGAEIDLHFVARSKGEEVQKPVKEEPLSPTSDRAQPRTVKVKVEPESPASSRSHSPPRRPNLNTTRSADVVKHVPGLGTKLARYVVEEARRHPFTTWNDVAKLPNIGEKRLMYLKARYDIRPPTPRE
jgi:DNA uptake protein ComE-like DNA-binding protein